MNKKPIAYILINHSHKYEWACREEGSFEDSKQDPNHVFNMISRFPHYRINIFSQVELDALIKSASYCGGEFGDTDEKVIQAEKGIHRAFLKLKSIKLS